MDKESAYYMYGNNQLNLPYHGPYLCLIYNRPVDPEQPSFCPCPADPELEVKKNPGIILLYRSNSSFQGLIKTVFFFNQKKKKKKASKGILLFFRSLKSFGKR